MRAYIHTFVHANLDVYTYVGRYIKYIYLIGNIIFFVYDYI